MRPKYSGVLRAPGSGRTGNRTTCCTILRPQASPPHGGAMIAKRSCASGWQYINARQSRSWIITRSARSCTRFPGWALSDTYSAVSFLPSGRTRLRGKLSNFAATQSFNSEQAWSSAFRLQEVRSRLKPELRPTAYELIGDRSGVQPSRNPKFQLRTSMEFSLQAARSPEQAQA